MSQRCFCRFKRITGVCLAMLLLTAFAARAQVVNSTTVDGWVSKMAFDEAHHRVYVSVLNWPYVSVLDSENLTLQGTVFVGFGQSDIVFDPQANRAYTTLRNNGGIAVIDGASLSVTATFGIGNATYPYYAYPSYLALDVQRRRLYVTHDVPAGTVSILDADTHSLLETIVTNAGSTTGVAYDPSRGFAYVASYQRTLHAIDGGRLQLMWTTQNAGAGDVRVDADHGLIYLGTNSVVESGHLTAVSAATQAVTGSVVLPADHIAVSPARRRVYAASYWNNRVDVVTGDLTQQLGTIFLPGGLSAISVRETTAHVWVADERGEIWVVADSFGNTAPVASAGFVTVSEDASAPVVLSGSDADGDSLSYALASLPAHGTLVGTAPNLTYRPNPDYFGSDSFTFTVNDGHQTSAPATVSVTVSPVNDAPFVSAGGPYRTVVGATVELTATGRDVDDVVLVYAWDLDGDGVFETSGATASYTPTTAGDHVVRIRVTDREGLSATSAATVHAGYAICAMYDASRAVRRGATVPLRVRLCDASGQNLSNVAVVVTAVGLAKLSDQSTGEIQDAGQSNPDGDFRYDSTMDGYVFNLQTTPLTSGTWMVSFRAGLDPELHQLTFQVR